MHENYEGMKKGVCAQARKLDDNLSTHYKRIRAPKKYVENDVKIIQLETNITNQFSQLFADFSSK